MSKSIHVTLYPHCYSIYSDIIHEGILGLSGSKVLQNATYLLKDICQIFVRRTLVCSFSAEVYIKWYKPTKSIGNVYILWVVHVHWRLLMNLLLHFVSSSCYGLPYTLHFILTAGCCWGIIDQFARPVCTQNFFQNVQARLGWNIKYEHDASGSPFFATPPLSTAPLVGKMGIDGAGVMPDRFSAPDRKVPCPP